MKSARFLWKFRTKPAVIRLLLVLLVFGNFVFIASFLPSGILRLRSGQVYALETDVNATVGDFTLTLNGIIAPFASIELSTSGNTFLQSTTANDQGAFAFNNVVIVRGLSGFCFNAVDFKNLGSSVTCLTIPAAQADVSMSDIFLPPTLGLSKTEMTSLDRAQAYGYTMPGATVVVYVGETTKTTTADSTGYYEIDIDGLSSGDYSVYAVANYQGRDSLKPTKYTQIKVLGFTSPSLTMLWIFLLFVILFFLLLWWKRRKKKRRS